MGTDKERYRAFCEVETAIPIFSKAWWLDSVCGEDNWDVVLAEQGGNIVASLPYYRYRRSVFSMILMPALTQNMGVYIIYPPDQKYENRISYEKEIINKLIVGLPRVDRFSQQFHYSFKNWLPFYWHGYEQTTHYTYVIDDLSDLDEVFSKFSRAKKKNIKRAEKMVSVKYHLSSEEFYQHHRQSLAKQNKRIEYSYRLFKQIYDNVYEHNAGVTIYAVDDQQKIHAALLIIWDKSSAYDLISTIDPEYRNSGASSLLVKEAIKYVSDRTVKFDFEGSMIENVEASFRQFGAIQKPYFVISKVNSRLLRLWQYSKEMLKQGRMS